MGIVGYEDLTPAESLRAAGAQHVMTRLDELPGLLGVGSEEVRRGAEITQRAQREEKSF